MNDSLFHVLNGLAGRSETGDTLIIFLTNPFAYLIAVILVIFFFHHKDEGGGARDGVVILSAAILSWFLALAFKEFFGQPRPFVAFGDITPLISVSSLDGSGAFPSGHTAFFASVVGSLYFYHRRAAYWFALIPLLIGFARVAAGVHFPIDILGGYLLGLAIGFGVYAFYHMRTDSPSGREREGAL